MPAYSRVLLPWDSQPQEAVSLDPHWISRGLIFLSLGNGVYWTRERGFFGAVNTISGAPRISASSVGLATGFGATSGAGTTDRLDVGTVYMGAVAFRSIVAWVYPRGTGGGGLGRVFQAVGSSGVDTVSGEVLFTNTTNNIKLTYGRTTTNTTQTAGITGSITLNAWSCFGFTHDQTGAVGAIPTCYENGVANSSVTTNGTAAGAFNTSPYTLSLGNRSTDNARNWDGQLGPIAIFDSPSSGLTANEHAELFRNFWSLFAPRSIWVPVSAGGGTTDLTVQDANHSHTADSPTLTVTTSTDLTIDDATHGHTADSLTITVATTLAVQEALHGHAADNLTVSTTGAVSLTIQDASHGHAADNLALTLDTTLAIADATHAHTADNLTISTSGAVNLTIQDATHAHTADSPTLTLGYVDLVIAEALHAHTADSPTLSVVEYTALVIARAVHAHTVDNLTLTFPLGALSDAEFREMYDWVKELHRIHGLTSGVDLVVTPTSRTAGAISQTISTAGSTVTVTR